MATALVTTPVLAMYGETAAISPSALPALCTLADVIAAAPSGSDELASYLAAVYGDASDNIIHRRARVWRWHVVDVIWLCHLPLSLRRRCQWPATPQSNGSVFAIEYDESRPRGWLWRYPHRTFCHCCGMPRHAPAFVDMPCNPEMGGKRRGVRIFERGFWVEVTHAYIRGQPFERVALWFYRAIGSGTWFFTGRTLIAEDTLDLARMLNRSLQDGYAAVSDRLHPYWPRINKQQVFEAIRKLGFDCVILTHHLDPDMRKFPRHAWYKTEVVGLRSHVRISCPPDGRNIAWGWLASRWPCRCLETVSEPICHVGKTVSFPFGVVVCNVNMPGTALDQSARRCTPRRFTFAGLPFDVAVCEADKHSGRGGDANGSATIVRATVIKPGCVFGARSHFRKFYQPEDDALVRSQEFVRKMGHTQAPRALHSCFGGG